MSWEGKDEQKQAIWDALEELRKEKEISNELISKAMQKEKNEIKHYYPYGGKLHLSRSTLERIKSKDKLFTCSYEILRILYNFLFVTNIYPTKSFNIIKSLVNTKKDEDFCQNQILSYFGVDNSTKTDNVSLQGKYTLYFYSELVKNGIVVGEFDVKVDEKNSINIIESQYYDGKLDGSLSMEDSFSGYGFFCFSSVVFLLRNEINKAPKFYIFSVPHDDKNNIPIMQGYMIKHSRNGAFYRSPVFVRRVQNGESHTCNIFKKDDTSVERISKILDDI